MEANLLYIACVIGAAALYLTLRPGRRGLRAAGALVGLGAFAWLVWAAPSLLQTMGGLSVRPEHRLDTSFVFFLIFSLIAIASAVRMITHDRPVYSALYFVLVVLSSAALFLLLQAEFMAFALIIVYAGAILITYLFVIMLAQQAPTPQQEAEADYDRLPREPAFACVVGFVLLAVLGNMVFAGVPGLTSRPSEPAIQKRMWEGLNQMPRELQAIVREQAPGAALAENARVEVTESGAYVEIKRAGESASSRLPIPPEKLPSNVQRVGLDLVAKFPVSLELAGVILLMAMFGAVVLARRQIELGEDEVREAAGMRRLAFHGDESSAGAAAASDARGGRS